MTMRMIAWRASRGGAAVGFGVAWRFLRAASAIEPGHMFVVIVEGWPGETQASDPTVWWRWHRWHRRAFGVTGAAAVGARPWSLRVLRAGAALRGGWGRLRRAGRRRHRAALASLCPMRSVSGERAVPRAARRGPLPRQF